MSVVETTSTLRHRSTTTNQPANPLPDDPIRWRRLERYARWKSRRFPLLSLPQDVIDVIGACLTDMEVLTLVIAYTGSEPDPNDPSSMEGIPLQLRTWWMRAVVVREFYKFFHTYVADASLYHARDGSSMVAFLDWTPFSPEEATPVAEMGWIQKRACLQVHRHVLERRVLDCIEKRLPMARLTVHHRLHWNDQVILHPDATLMHLVPIVPQSWCNGTIDAKLEWIH